MSGPNKPTSASKAREAKKWALELTHKWEEKRARNRRMADPNTDDERRLLADYRQLKGTCKELMLDIMHLNAQLPNLRRDGGRKTFKLISGGRHD